MAVPAGKSIDVMVVEDHPDFRRDLVELLSALPDMHARGFGSWEDALSTMTDVQPQIVVMDIKLPGVNGIQATRSIKQRWPEVQVMICTVHEDDDMIFSALRAGATGYLLKRSPFKEIEASIRMVLQGGSPMSPAIARRVVGSFQTTTTGDDPSQLTSREQDVLDLMARGLRDKEIADELSISINTVRTHIRHIYEKLQVQGRVEAVNKGTRGR
ncbi:MAG TPA: response regulator transcription factor [Flavobacteriales bacterium]|nr:response regulator transcription factor [Flavobacteriales bacterium]